MKDETLFETLRSTTEKARERQQQEQLEAEKQQQAEEEQRAKDYFKKNTIPFIDLLKAKACAAAKDGDFETEIAGTVGKDNLLGLEGTMRALAQYFEAEGFKTFEGYSDNSKPRVDREPVPPTEFTRSVEIAWGPEPQQ